jgi:hypothetical protein
VCVCVCVCVIGIQAQTDHEPWAQDMCKNPLPCGSDHQALAKALLANLLRLTQSEPDLDSLVAVGKDMQILFRCVCACGHLSLLPHAF